MSTSTKPVIRKNGAAMCKVNESMSVKDVQDVASIVS